jgi:ATP-dependent Lon protease
MLEGLDRADYEVKDDVMSALLEIFDPVKNQNFTDRYLAVPFNLSPVIFIGTAGSADTIQSPLRDLLDIITL